MDLSRDLQVICRDASHWCSGSPAWVGRHPAGEGVAAPGL